MKKSVYSLVLSDEVVRAVDRLAYVSGISRSGMINRILAEYASMLTPEKRVNDIFQRVARLAGGDSLFQIQGQPTGNLMSIKSAINYKYNPTIRYSVEITAGNSEYVGEFRAISRSQSRDLLDLLDGFFRLWVQVEAESIPKGLLNVEISPGRMRRRLVAEGKAENSDSQRLGDSIAMYIHLFDRGMNLYFTDKDQCGEALRELYGKYLEEAPVTI